MFQVSLNEKECTRETRNVEQTVDDKHVYEVFCRRRFRSLLSS